MDKDRIKVGGIYLNKNQTHARKVLDFDHRYLCLGTKEHQKDTNCLLYKTLSGDNRGYNGSPDILHFATLKAFAKWAKYEIQPATEMIKRNAFKNQLNKEK